MDEVGTGLAVTEAMVTLILLTWREELIEASARAAEKLLRLGLEPDEYLLRSLAPTRPRSRRGRQRAD